MAVALHVQQGTPGGVEKHLQAALYRIHDLIQALPEAGFARKADLLIRTGTVQLRIGFDHMQERVHGPGGKHPVLAQLFIGFRHEIRFLRLQVAALVPAFGFDDAKQGTGPVQRAGIACEPVIGCQSVNGEGLTVGMLGGVRRLSVISDRPEQAAVFRIPEAVQETIGMIRVYPQVRPFQHSGSRRKEPQDTAVQDAAFVCFPVQL